MDRLSLPFKKVRRVPYYQRRPGELVRQEDGLDFFRWTNCIHEKLQTAEIMHQALIILCVELSC